MSLKRRREALIPKLREKKLMDIEFMIKYVERKEYTLKYYPRLKKL